MDKDSKKDQLQHCTQCDSHCPADALKCGRGRKYFGLSGKEHDGSRLHRSGGSLSHLLHRCGRFVHHSELSDGELFQPLSAEEQAALRTALEKLAGSWTAQYGEGALHRHGGKGHKHGGHGK